MNRWQPVRQRASHLTFRLIDVFNPRDPLSVPLLRLMAATNDARQTMKQIIRGHRGGRQPHNRAERGIRTGEQLYLVRMLCGHLEEAGDAFSNLWRTQRTRRRLRKVIVQDEAGRAALQTLERELLNTGQGGLRTTFVNPVRNNWAFHYRDGTYRTALADAVAGVDAEGELVITDAQGLSRYLVIDDFITRAMLQAVGGQPRDYETAVRMVVQIAGALGKVVDRLIVGLLHVPGANFDRRDVFVHLDRGLARGQREAAQRRIVAAEAGCC